MQYTRLNGAGPFACLREAQEGETGSQWLRKEESNRRNVADPPTEESPFVSLTDGLSPTGLRLYVQQQSIANFVRLYVA